MMITMKQLHFVSLKSLSPSMKQRRRIRSTCKYAAPKPFVDIRAPRELAIANR